MASVRAGLASSRRDLGNERQRESGDPAFRRRKTFRILNYLYTRVFPAKVRWLPRYYEVLKTFAGNGRKKILEIGCGRGHVACELAKNRAKVIGIDHCESEIRSAVAAARATSSPATFCVADISNLPFRDRLFDVVVALDCLEYLRDMKATFAEVCRVLKPGAGLLIFTIPHLSTCSARLFWVQRFLRKSVPRWLHSKPRINTKSWLEASSEEEIQKDGRLKDYDVDELLSSAENYFRLEGYRYALRLFSALTTDITYGIRGFSAIQPFLFFLSVRLDHYLFAPHRPGYLLVVEMVARE